MDSIGGDFHVNEGAFWHTNMDLYYGFQIGEVVEVEHEFNKYWLATIKYSFKHLILLKWLGNYGEFWVDTSQQQQNPFQTNLTMNSNHNVNKSNDCDDDNINYKTPRRLFPLGHHLQSQIKSQFILEKPTKFLMKPTLYNPANDPYSVIETVEDLLAFDNENVSNGDLGPADSVLVKCKTKVSYRQEDEDELEAALQNLTEIDSGMGLNQEDGSSNDEPEFNGDNNKISNEINCVSETTTKPAIIQEATKSMIVKEVQKQNNTDELEKISKEEYQKHLELCKNLQDSAINKGRYAGIDENKDKIYYLKPKQFYDLGGVNHERVFVPGTLLEVCHSVENNSDLELCHWFAVVLKNIGGRLTLRWFLCDEPKFKQGRLELKSFKSNYIREDDEISEEGDSESMKDCQAIEESNFGPQQKSTSSANCNVDEINNGCMNQKISAKTITFSMHFCNPCIHTISHAKSIQSNRPYKMPTKIVSILSGCDSNQQANDTVEKLQQDQINLIFDPRRMNLDRDRPLIDHLLSTIRWMMPQYVQITFAPKDGSSKREVLISTSKTTKLLRGSIKREIESGVYEIVSESLKDTLDEHIKFIYPYDSSFTVLPLEWAVNNQDCLSVNTSRNLTPIPPMQQATPVIDQQSVIERVQQEDDAMKEYSDLNREEEEVAVIISTLHSVLSKIERKEQLDLGEQSEDASIDINSLGKTPHKLLCEIVKTDIVEEKDFIDDKLDPHYWSRLNRIRELDETNFDCRINKGSMESTMSKFRVMDQLEVVHPSSDVIICTGRIRKIAFPLLWIQISADSYTLLPFNSTDIYPSQWCESNNHQLISLLPPRKRLNHQTLNQLEKKRKRAKFNDDANVEQSEQEINDQRAMYEKEHFDLSALNDKQLDIDYILNEKSMYIRIFFNHKCFTGPSLSKGKICSLPQYVGPGPLRLVIEEVITKIISVAYVPPRILNDLSSKSFEDLLIARQLTNTTPMEFKAKYQKRVHRDDIPVCLNLDDVARYCECVCEHLKCCYNLFGPNLYDGDDCPGHCRALTKSNKFMKRATYYREKARLGEFTNDNNANNNSNKKSLNNGNSNSGNKSSRACYAGRGSSESTNSSLSRSELVNSRASSAEEAVENNSTPVITEELSKENPPTIDEETNNEDAATIKNQDTSAQQEVKQHESNCTPEPEVEVKPQIETLQEDIMNVPMNNILIDTKPRIKWPNESEFTLDTNVLKNIYNWTPEDVAVYLDFCHLDSFVPYMISEVSVVINFIH